MSAPRRKFSKEFKQEAVKMVLEDGLSKAEVSRRLDLSQGILGNWMKSFQADGIVAFPGNGKLKPQDEELRQLKKKLRDLQMENEFLKKSAAYFASLKK